MEREAVLVGIDAGTTKVTTETVVITVMTRFFSATFWRTSEMPIIAFPAIAMKAAPAPK